MAVKAINNTAGLDKLVPTFLVYRAYLRISNLNPSAPFIIEQAAIIQKAMAEIVKLRAKQTINNALHYRNGPNTTLVYNLLLNSKVLIQRKSGKQTRPYYLLAVENKICCVQLLSRLIRFKSTSIKPYFWPKDTYNIKPDKLKVTAKLNKLEVTAGPDKLEVTTELDKLEVLLPTLKVP